MRNKRFIALYVIIIIILMTGIAFVIFKPNIKSNILLKEYSIHAKEIIVDGKVVNVQSVLENICNEKKFEEKYSDYAASTGIECNDINIYPDRYYLKYVATDKFRTELLEVNTNGVSGDMFAENAEIYLPVFAHIDGDERIIASIRIYFDRRDKSYHAIESLPYFDIDSENFFERIEHFIDEKQITDCIWVYDSNHQGYAHASIMIVKIDGIYKVYDYENVLDESEFTPTFLDVKDYVAKKDTHELENAPEYPNVNIIPIAIFLFIAVAILVALIVVQYVIRKLH